MPISYVPSLAGLITPHCYLGHKMLHFDMWKVAQSKICIAPSLRNDLHTSAKILKRGQDFSPSPPTAQGSLPVPNILYQINKSITANYHMLTMGT